MSWEMLRLPGGALEVRTWLLSGLAGLLTGLGWALIGPCNEPPAITIDWAGGIGPASTNLAPSNMVGTCDHRPDGPPPPRDLASEVRRCPEEMQLVEGEYCPALRHICSDPVRAADGRCDSFLPSRSCPGERVPMSFCIDVYEYPNQRGVRPVVMVDFHQANAACAREGKRLCTGREWTHACEGPDWWPYPQGHSRERERCNVDQLHRFPDPGALLAQHTTSAELTRLDQREVSGARAGCVSRYGVFDLTGNVDEWVLPDGPEHAAGENHPVGLKGGYFGRVRNQCRPTTLAHGPDFRFYQVGFRCCRDPD